MPEEPLEGDIIKFYFRCPNGDTMTRNFDRAERLELLYNWVELNEEIEFEGDRNFDLYYSYPPESLK